MFKVYIVWGRVKCHKQVYEFNTEAEKNAFLHGIEEASGYEDYTVCDNEEEYNQIKLDV
jgi:hypothetical protein